MESKVNTIFEIVEREEEKTIHMHTETHTHTDASMYNNIHIDWIFWCRLVYMRTEKKFDEKPNTPKITAKYFNKKLFLVWYLSQSNRYTNDDSYRCYINSVSRCICICWRMSLAFSIIRWTAGSKNGLLHFKVCVRTMKI